jgi:hypothetical protein
MISLKEQLKNLENILLNQTNLSPENKQVLSKEIKRLEQELTKLAKDKPATA